MTLLEMGAIYLIVALVVMAVIVLDAPKRDGDLGAMLGAGLLWPAFLVFHVCGRVKRRKGQ